MAEPIQSVAASTIPKVGAAGLFAAMQPGDLVFCWGCEPISQAIEKFTAGPSHVLKVWLPWPGLAPWLTLEAEYGRGVRFGQFEDYLSYPGDLVLCRRALTLDQVKAEIAFGAGLLDFKYDTIEFASLVARKLSTRFPLIQPDGQLYCSGLQQAIAAKSVPFNIPDKPWATPEQLYTDPSVVAVCAQLKS